jgi:hypothetical protein
MLRNIGLFAILLSAGAAQAAPASMLIVTYGMHAFAVATLQFASLSDCEASADHLAKVRTPSGSTLGVTGAWKKNMTSSSEPPMAFICLPSASEIPGVADSLNQKGLYRDLNK